MSLVTVTGISTTTLSVGSTFIINGPTTNIHHSNTYLAVPAEFDGAIKTSPTTGESYTNVQVTFNKNVEVLAWSNSWNTLGGEVDEITSENNKFTASSSYDILLGDGYYQYNHFTRTFNEGETHIFPNLGMFNNVQSFIHLAFRELPPTPSTEETEYVASIHSVVSQNANIQSGQWNYVSFTYDKNSNTGKLYINDKEVGSASNVAIDMTNDLSDINIGHGDDGQYVQGVLDDVSIYNTKYTDEMIRNLKNNQSSVDAFLKNKVIGHWDFNDFKHELGTFLDKSAKTSATTEGTLSYDTNPNTSNNRTVAFDGSLTNYLTVDNSESPLSTSNLGVSVLVRPTSYSQTILSKPDAFDLKINSSGVVQLEIGNTPHVGALNTSVKGHFDFNDNITNLKNTSIVATASNILYDDSYNETRCLSLNGTDSFVIAGELIPSGSESISVSMWVNLSNLQNESTDTTYSLLNMKDVDDVGFDWNISKIGSALATEFIASLPFPTINEEFNIPGTYTWVSPGKGKITVELIGAKGGSYQQLSTSGNTPGGGGGRIAVHINVVTGQEYTLVVASQGESGLDSIYQRGNDKRWNGGGGGGGSGFKVLNEVDDWMVIAGGGGGGSINGEGGNGGVPTTWNGEDGYTTNVINGDPIRAGRGGTITAAGSGGTSANLPGSDGSAFNGGDGANKNDKNNASDVLGGTGVGNGGKGGTSEYGSFFAAAAGGGGWFGGGGGGIDDFSSGYRYAGAGGGGSSYYNTSDTRVEEAPDFTPIDNLGEGYIRIYTHIP